MRLTTQQHQAIREEVANVFGGNAAVRLFGSRVDDNLRGGDIDLHIEFDGSPQQRLERQLALSTRLLHRLGNRRIDIIVQSSGMQRPIDIQAIKTGILL